MKKIIHLLMAALPLLGMTACSDDDKDQNCCLQLGG